MTLTVNPELEREIVLQAQAHGVSVEVYAAELLQRDLMPADEVPMPISVSTISSGEFLTGLIELSETATAVKNYPPDFFSRDVLYADHD